MIGHPLPHQLREPRPQQVFLLRRERHRIGQRKFAGKLPGESLGILPMGRKHEHRTKIFPQRAGHAPAPEALDAARQTVDQVVDVHLLQRHGTLPMLDDLDGASEPAQPRGDFLGIGDVAAEQEQLHRRRQ